MATRPPSEARRGLPQGVMAASNVPESVLPASSATEASAAESPPTPAVPPVPPAIAVSPPLPPTVPATPPLPPSAPPAEPPTPAAPLAPPVPAAPPASGQPPARPIKASLQNTIRRSLQATEGAKLAPPRSKARVQPKRRPEQPPWRLSGARDRSRLKPRRDAVSDTLWSDIRARQACHNVRRCCGATLLFSLRLHHRFIRGAVI
jgi:hypothetical protein